MSARHAFPDEASQIILASSHPNTFRNPEIHLRSALVPGTYIGTQQHYVGKPAVLIGDCACGMHEDERMVLVVFVDMEKRELLRHVRYSSFQSTPVR